MKDRYRDLHAQHLTTGEALDDTRTQLQHLRLHHERVCQEHTQLLAAAASREQVLSRQVQSMETLQESNDEKLLLIHRQKERDEREQLQAIEAEHNSKVSTMTQQIVSLQAEVTRLRQCHEEESNQLKLGANQLKVESNQLKLESSKLKLESNQLTEKLLSLQGKCDQREEENKSSRRMLEDMERQHAQTIAALQNTQRSTGMIFLDDF